MEEKYFDMGELIVVALAHLEENIFKDESKTVFTKQEILDQIEKSAKAINEGFTQLGLDFDEPVKFDNPIPYRQQN